MRLEQYGMNYFPNDVERHTDCSCDGVVGVYSVMCLRYRHRLERPRSVAGWCFEERDGASQQWMGQRHGNFLGSTKNWTWVISISELSFACKEENKIIKARVCGGELEVHFPNGG